MTGFGSIAGCVLMTWKTGCSTRRAYWSTAGRGGPRRIGWMRPGLLRTLMALERGETQVCRVVHVPSPEQEDARRRSRERARLVVERGCAFEPYQGPSHDTGRARF